MIADALRDANVLATSNSHSLQHYETKSLEPECRCLGPLLWKLEVNPPPLPVCRMVPHTPLVSVVTPTSTDRHWSHAHLHRSFSLQSYPNKELVVLDTGDKPSPYFEALEDPRVRYTHIALPGNGNAADLLHALRSFVAAADSPPGGGEPTVAWIDAWSGARKAIEQTEREHEWYELEDEGVDSPVYLRLVRDVLTLGGKRNWLLAHARGEYVANFDDDDVYCAPYLSRMVSAMHAHRAELCKLSGWMHYDFTTMAHTLCDVDNRGLNLANEIYAPSASQPGLRAGPANAAAFEDDLRQSFSFAAADAAALHGTRWGFGFSYVHATILGAHAPYPPVNFGEDYKMVTAAAAAGYTCVCFTTRPRDAIALHVSHTGNSSYCGFGVQVGVLRAEEDEAAFNAYYAQPPNAPSVAKLVAAQGKHLAVGLLADAIAKAREIKEQSRARGWSEEEVLEHLNNGVPLPGRSRGLSSYFDHERLESSVMRALERAGVDADHMR